MRDLLATNKNEIVIQDNLSNTRIIFYYKTIKTADRLSYNSEMLKSLTEGGDIKVTQEKQLNFVLDYITGFEEGSFSYDGAVISCDENSKNYKADWKVFLKENASDLLFTVSGVLFGQPNYHLKKNFHSLVN